MAAEHIRVTKYDSFDDLRSLRLGGNRVVQVAFRTATRNVEELALVRRQLPVMPPPLHQVRLLILVSIALPSHIILKHVRWTRKAARQQ